MSTHTADRNQVDATIAAASQIASDQGYRVSRTSAASHAFIASLIMANDGGIVTHQSVEGAKFLDEKRAQVRLLAFVGVSDTSRVENWFVVAAQQATDKIDTESKLDPAFVRLRDFADHFKANPTADIAAFFEAIPPAMRLTYKGVAQQLQL